MAVQPIKKDGLVVAYQARVGGGGPGQTRNFTLAKHGPGARDLAGQAERDLLDSTGARGKLGHHFRTSKTNTSGIVGINAQHEGDNVRIRATWSGCATGYSVEKHGLEGAMALALAAREKHSGIKLGITPTQALDLIQPQLAALAARP